MSNSFRFRFDMMIFGLNLLIRDLIIGWCRENGFQWICQPVNVYTLNGCRSLEVLGRIQFFIL